MSSGSKAEKKDKMPTMNILLNVSNQNIATKEIKRITTMNTYHHLHSSFRFRRKVHDSDAQANSSVDLTHTGRVGRRFVT